MTDTELRELCNRFFDAIERRDMAEIAASYEDGLEFWINIRGTAKSKEESLAATRDGYPLHRRRTYNDRRIDTFDGGFLMRYTLNITRHDGQTSAYWASVVALCRDDRIYRIDEYIDAGKFPKPIEKTDTPETKELEAQ